MKLAGTAMFVALFAGSAFAADITTVNGISFQNRFYNDISDSTLNATSAGTSAHWDENYATDTTHAAWTNRHFAWLSNDGGATPFQMWGGGYQSGGQSFNIQFDTNVGGNANSEAGLGFANNRHNHAPPFVDFGGGLYIKGNGEVFLGAGSAIPFYGAGFIYTPGTNVHVSFTYNAPGNGNGSIQFSLSGPGITGGSFTSPVIPWGAEPDNIGGFGGGSQIGFFAQFPRPGSETYSIDFNNVVVTPAPGAFALLGLGGLVAGRRRR